jgi:hypothetical protein
MELNPRLLGAIVWPMKLPRASKARVDESKVVGYLLSRVHPDGGSKARFFERFGFRSAEWMTLAEALKEHGQGNEVVNVVETGHGRRYSVDGSIRSPDRRNPAIRTVWIVEPGVDVPRLITAYPLEEP